jgi:uncharacterized membrane protein YgdD (TMEM256/DUF423 family)
MGVIIKKVCTYQLEHSLDFLCVFLYDFVSCFKKIELILTPYLNSFKGDLYTLRFLVDTNFQAFVLKFFLICYMTCQTSYFCECYFGY